MADVLSSWIEALPHLASGLLVSLQICIMSLAVGVPAGLLFAILQKTGPKPVGWLIVGLVEIGRGAPALVILYLAYFGLPEIGISASATAAAVAGLGFSTAAYTSEMFRAALESVPGEQLEAADVLGLSSFDKYRFVVLPLALRVVIPPVLGFCIVLFQGTSLCFAIAVPEMLSKAYNFASITFRYLPVLTLAGLIYASIAVIAAQLVGGIEERMSRYL